MNNKKILFSIITLSITVAPLVTQAQAVGLKGLICTLGSTLTALGAGLSTIAFIIAGIMFLSATYNPSNLEVAKKALLAAVIGIVIILLANQAATFVSGLFGNAFGGAGGTCP